jgi:translation initiation factor 2B subunit (eIF-2B alpha/beta/delta family)
VRIITEAKRVQKKSFSVLISGEKLNQEWMISQINSLDLDITFSSFNTITALIKQATKVIICAEGMSKDKEVIGPSGSTSVALNAKLNSLPLLTTSMNTLTEDFHASFERLPSKKIKASFDLIPKTIL